MLLADLLTKQNIATDLMIELVDMEIDSRNVNAGSLFCAYKGSAADGRDYLSQAQDNGAVAALYDPEDFELPGNITIPVFAVANLQEQVV